MKTHTLMCTFALSALLLLMAQVQAAGERQIPYPAALDSAAITVERLDRIQDDALLLGNGDINALIYSSPAELRMMLTKNDVWDARLITANDPPLPKFRWIKQAASEFSPGGNTEIDEDGFRKNRRDGYHDYPYPFPKPCAQLVFGNDVSARSWRIVRAGGSQNAFLPQDNGAVMRIAGEAGCSNGYAISLKGHDLSDATRLCIELSGTPNAHFFIDVLNETGANNRFGLHTGWISSPANDTVREFELAEPDKHDRLILYTWSTDGKLAENHIRRITLRNTSGEVISELPLDEQALTAHVFHGTLDIGRAVAQVLDPTSKQCLLTARALADRNAFRIDSSLPCRIVPTATFDSQPLQEGTTDDVAWLVQELPGDGDWQGMTYAVALARESQTKAVAIVTSLEADDPRQAAIRLAADALAMDGKEIIDSHLRRWQEFWSASGVELEDRFLQDLWYRNLYFLRCVSKPGVECVGLYAGSVTEGCPAWHGNHTLNYNAQQTFWSAFVSNHVELSEPYVRLIDRYMTRARWLCQQIFEFDGAYIPHVVLAHEPVDPAHCKSHNGRQYIHHVWGFTIGVPAFAVQNLWHRYQYPTAGDDEPVVVDVRDAPPITYNIAIPAVPVFPGDQVTWFSSAQQRSLLARSIDQLNWNGNNSSIILSVARARLSMPGSIDFMRTTFRDRLKPNGTLGINRVGTGINRNGHYTEQFAATMAVSELLLQSVDGIIRVFPAWPEDKDASFADLRAQGGFLVTAEQRGGEAVGLEIISTVGGKLRILGPWPTIKVNRGVGRQNLRADARGVFEIDTKAGEKLVFSAD